MNLASTRFVPFAAIAGAFLAVLFIVTLAWGQSLALATKKDQPVAIASERMELDSQKSMVRFFGSVVARQGTFELRSQQLVAEYDPDGEIQTLSSQGDVRFTDQGRSGTAQFATYAVATSSLTMTGDPVVREGGNVLAGSRIDYSTRTGQLKVENARTRFYQQQAKELAGSSSAP